MPLVIDPKQYIIGAADVYYRAIASVGPWSSIGATVDDVVFRVNQTTFNPSEDFNGILEPIREMDYISKACAEAESRCPSSRAPSSPWPSWARSRRSSPRPMPAALH